MVLEFLRQQTTKSTAPLTCLQFHMGYVTFLTFISQFRKIGDVETVKRKEMKCPSMSASQDLRSQGTMRNGTYSQMKSAL